MDNKNQNVQNSSLIEFISRAGKLGKYNPNSARDMIGAIKTAERGLTHDEPKEIDYLESHVEELFFRQKDLTLTPQSQAVYFTRIKRAIADFRKYGLDARAIYGWNPKVIQRSSKKKTEKEEIIQESLLRQESQQRQESNQRNDVQNNDLFSREANGTKLHFLTLLLRPGVVIRVELPEDLNAKDIRKITGFLNLHAEEELNAD
jgi:hypothetical protein